MTNKKHTLHSGLTAYLTDDLRAGIVVFLVALPLCLGIALASGAPLFAGIITGVIGGIVVGSLSGSRFSVSGPAAGLTVIVLSAIEKLGYPAFLLAVVLAGVIQIILGILKAGAISNYFPSAVIKGMLAAIGITLILKQIPHALGYDADAEGEFEFWQLDGENTFSEILKALNFISPGAVIITVLSIAILLVWARPAIQRFSFFKVVPAPLVVVALGILLNNLFRGSMPGLALDQSHLVSLPEASSIGDFFSFFQFPDFTQFANLSVYVSAFTLAIVASLETLLNIEATDKLDPNKHQTPTNRELIAQGTGNIISGLVGGMPLTSVIVRSSVNINSGAKTKLSAIFHGILLFACVVGIPGLLNQIPLACLAAILLVTGYKLANVALFRQMYGFGGSQWIPFVVTILAVLFTDLLIGIGIGSAVGIFFILKANYKTSYFFEREKDRDSEITRINLSQHVSFLNKSSLVEILESLPENSYVEINAANSVYIDHDIKELIEDFKQTAKLKNIEVDYIEQQPEIPVEIVPEKEKVEEPPVSIHKYHELFARNREWVTEKLSLDPNYFEDMARGQAPAFLFISCSDSRIPANEMTGTNPGEMFVHRNIANLVVNTDLNFLSVLQYAVEVLKVQHVIVCGHYGCGGVKAAMGSSNLGLINKWLRNIKDVYRLYFNELEAIRDEDERFKRLVELNVREQVYNLHKTSIVQQAYNDKANLHIHGWVYDIREGYLRDLEIDAINEFETFNKIYRYDMPVLKEAE
jgi:carbonic anhydrase